MALFTPLTHSLSHLGKYRRFQSAIESYELPSRCVDSPLIFRLEDRLSASRPVVPMHTSGNRRKFLWENCIKVFVEVT
jgi:hypothetical protein